MNISLKETTQQQTTAKSSEVETKTYLMLSIKKYQEMKRAVRRVVCVDVSIVFHSCLSPCVLLVFIALLRLEAAPDWSSRNVISP